MKLTYIKQGLGMFLMLGGMSILTSCEEDDLFLGKPTDESKYENNL